MVFEKVRSILSEQFDVEEDSITLETSIINDLGADSLDVVDLLMNIDDEFGVEVPDEDVEKVKTVEDLALCQLVNIIFIDNDRLIILHVIIIKNLL